MSDQALANGTFRPNQRVRVAFGPSGQDCEGVIAGSHHGDGRYAVFLSGMGTFDFHASQISPYTNGQPAPADHGAELRVIARQLEQLANGLDHLMVLIPSLARSARTEAQRLERILDEQSLNHRERVAEIAGIPVDAVPRA